MMSVENRVNQIATIAIGVLLVLLGLGIIKNPIFQSSFGYYFKFGAYGTAVGLALISLGAVILVSSYRRYIAPQNSQAGKPGSE